MGTIFAVIAGIFNSATNFSVKRASSTNRSTKNFFFWQMAASGVFAIILGPCLKGDFTIYPYLCLIGILAGFVLYVMLFSMGQAVKRGEAGLTFAILNAATVLPGILRRVFFGGSFSFFSDLSYALGLLVLLGGLFLGISNSRQQKCKHGWTVSLLLMFISHAVLLSIFSIRSVLRLTPGMEYFSSDWFTPFMFLTCGSIQTITYFISERRLPGSENALWGFFGGLTNLLSTLFLLLAAEKAFDVESYIIFPIASVASIIVTNIWSMQIYREKVNWIASLLLILGIFICSNTDFIIYAFAIAGLTILSTKIALSKNIRSSLNS